MRLQRKSRHQFVRGVCNVLDSVSPQQEFEAMERPVLQLSFIWQAKENASLRCEQDRPIQKTRREDRGPDPKQGKERGPQLNFGSSFYMLFCFCFFFLLSLSLIYEIGLARKAVCFTWGSQVWGPSFVLFLWALSLLCRLATAILDSFFLL